MSSRIRQDLEASLDGFAHESITVSSVAKKLTFATFSPAPTTGRTAERALITTETDAIRYTYDGTTPTSSVGHLLPSGTVMVLAGYGNISRFQAIRVTTDATIKVSYER